MFLPQNIFNDQRNIKQQNIYAQHIYNIFFKLLVMLLIHLLLLCHWSDYFPLKKQSIYLTCITWSEVSINSCNSLFIKTYRVCLRVLEKNNDRFYVGENDKSDLNIRLFQKEE